MPDEINKQIRNTLSEVFPNQQVASKITDMVVHKKPFGWSRKSNAPYYDEMYGKQLQVEANKMLATGQSRVFRYSTWCNEDTGVSHNTLYNRVNQSIRFLVEQMDTPDKKYYKWYRSILVTRERGIGIVLTFKVGIHDTTLFTADEIQPRETMPKWKVRMEDWLESGDSISFCEEGLALSPEEIIELTATLGTLTNIAASVKSDSVKIIRVS